MLEQKQGLEDQPSLLERAREIEDWVVDNSRLRKLATWAVLCATAGTLSAGVKVINQRQNQEIEVVTEDCPAEICLPHAASAPRPTEAQPKTEVSLPKRLVTPAPTTTTTAPPPSEKAKVITPPPHVLAPLFNFVKRHRGIDVSWPNCPAKHDAYPEVPPDTHFGFVGVNNGSPFTYNLCFKAQTQQFSNLSVYVNTAYRRAQALQFRDVPKHCSEQDDYCLAYNYGFKAGQEAVKHVMSQGVRTRIWWLDVETANSWSRNKAVNVQSLQGEMDAIYQYASAYMGGPVGIGFYSNIGLWHAVTDDWRNGYPAWVATGHGGPDVAISRCTEAYNFTGSQTTPIVQYVDDTLKLDRNIVC